MRRKDKPARKRAIARNSKSQSLGSVDPVPPEIKRERKLRKDRQAIIERSKKSLRCFPDAEEYLKGGIGILTDFVASKVVATSDQCYIFTDKRTMERLGRLIVEHLVPCVEVLSRIALCGERNAIRAALDYSVHLARIIGVVSQTFPDCQRETGVSPALIYASRKWTTEGEFAALNRDSVLNLEQNNSLQPANPALRIVLDFMQSAMSIRREMFNNEKLFCRYSHAFREKTLNRYLVDQCGFSSEQLVYKSLPNFTRRSARLWWEKALKPFLSSENTLNSIRRAHPVFYKKLTDAAVNRKDGSSKDYKIRDELKKRCRQALFRLARQPG